ncbi:hypothetical protein SAMN05421545_1817 [Pontibacter lucknowensis]|uniref:Uncharacterized protein n=1 Tax=Pontibacter lucknowensis TaxID=1077936 RepID=A0A1N6WXV6_9BACT|nr:hypothetical protein SAMN05421545_1817 [Pontibacter lucknowensis]
MHGIKKPLTDKKLDEISMQNTSIHDSSRTLKNEPM